MWGCSLYRNQLLCRKFLNQEHLLRRGNLFTVKSMESQTTLSAHSNSHLVVSKLPQSLCTAALSCSVRWFSPTYHVGIHTRSSRLCYCEGASDCGIITLTLKLTAYSWSNKSCLSTPLCIGLSIRLTSAAMRINTSYHQGSLSSKARLSSSTLSWQGNLTSPPTLLWLPVPTNLFFLAPFPVFPAQSLLTITF